MNLIYQRDKSFNDFANIKPAKYLSNPLDEQNSMTFGLKTNNYQLFISSPGYHQKTMIPLINLNIMNSFCDIHYESTEKKNDVVIRPKFGSYPIQLLLYPLQGMNFKLLWNFASELPSEISTKASYDIKINSFKKKVRLTPSLFFSFYPINISASGSLYLSPLKPYLLYRFLWTVGFDSLYLGSCFLKDKDYNDVYEFTARFYSNGLDLRFWISQPSNKNEFNIKNSLEYNNFPYKIFLTSKFNNNKSFKVASKLSYENKSVEFGFDDSKKFKLFFDTPLGCDAFLKLGMTVDSNVSFEDPPLFKACLTFDKSSI